MLNTVLGALLPMVVTFLLGFVAAWHHDLGRNDASILNRMVLLYAVPLALFAGTVTTSRAALGQDIPLVIVYEDEHILVINKPAGLVVHPGAGQADGTLVSGLLARYPEMATVGEPLIRAQNKTLAIILRHTNNHVSPE